MSTQPPYSSGGEPRLGSIADQFGEEVAVRERELGIGEAIAVEGVIRLPDGELAVDHARAERGEHLATYASLFPHSYRALVLEGALDPDR